MLQIQRNIRMLEGRPIGILLLHGTIDSIDSWKLERAIDEIFAQDVFDIVLDVGQVSHVSSAGWSVIVSKLSLLGDKRGFFRFCHMRTEVRKVFEIVGLELIPGIELHTDVDVALAACRAMLHPPVPRPPAAIPT
jgi:anti-anti-sigma factor